MVAMAATVTLRGGASIFYSSIVSSMGIIRVPLYSVLLCFKNDCPSTCRPTQSMTRTHKEDIMMCCVYEYVHVHVRKNEYLRTPICVYKYKCMGHYYFPLCPVHLRAFSLWPSFSLYLRSSLAPPPFFFRPLASFLSTSMTIILLHICSWSLRLSVVMNLLAPSFSYQLPRPSFSLLRSGTTPCISLCF